MPGAGREATRLTLPQPAAMRDGSGNAMQGRRDMFRLAILGSALIATPAAALECAPRSVLIKSLAETYQEAPVAIGLVGDGKRVMELFVSADGTWSITATEMSDPDPVSCFVGGGVNWTVTRPIPLPGKVS